MVVPVWLPIAATQPSDAKKMCKDIILTVDDQLDLVAQSEWTLNLVITHCMDLKIIYVH